MIVRKGMGVRELNSELGVANCANSETFGHQNQAGLVYLSSLDELGCVCGKGLNGGNNKSIKKC